MAFDPTSKRIACGDAVGNIVVWDYHTRRPIHQFKTGAYIRSIVFLEHPRCVVSHGSVQGKDAVFLFDLKSGKESKVGLAGGVIRSLAVDRAGSRVVVGLLSGAIGSLSLPDLVAGTRLEKTHDGSVNCAALSPDGRLLITGGADHHIVLRDAKSFAPLLAFPTWAGELRDLTFDAKGRRLAIVGTDSDVDLWDLDALRDGLTAIGLAWADIPG
jgi:WD40 repeat protein